MYKRQTLASTWPGLHWRCNCSMKSKPCARDSGFWAVIETLRRSTRILTLGYPIVVIDELKKYCHSADLEIRNPITHRQEAMMSTTTKVLIGAADCDEAFTRLSRETRSRREFLTGSAAVGVTLLLPGFLCAAPVGAKTFTILHTCLLYTSRCV